MIRLDHRQPVPENMRGGIVALGNFDGFHLGHQAVVGEAVEWAWEQGYPAIVATFDPHPVRHFAPQVPPFRLTTLDQREELFAAAGADAMLVFRFDEALAATTAEDFVELATHLGLHGTNYVVGWTAWLDLSPVGVSKASGLEHVADKLGLTQHDVLAIGDGRNDIEMLEWAGRGVAMGQAVQEVIDAADDVTDSVDDNGAATELDRWFG